MSYWSEPRNQLSPKRSPLFNRAPFAKSVALTGLRPSTLTSPSRKTVVSPHQINNSFFSVNKVAGTPPPAPLGKPTAPSLDTGSAQTWQLCPRNVVYTPGHRPNPRILL